MYTISTPRKTGICNSPNMQQHEKYERERERERERAPSTLLGVGGLERIRRGPSCHPHCHLRCHRSTLWSRCYCCTCGNSCSLHGKRERHSPALHSHHQKGIHHRKAWRDGSGFAFALLGVRCPFPTTVGCTSLRSLGGACRRRSSTRPHGRGARR